MSTAKTDPRSDRRPTGRHAGATRVPVRRQTLPGILSRWSFVLPAVIVLVAVLVYPVAYTIQVSFSSFNLFTFSPDKWIGFDNYRTVLVSDAFWNSMKVTGLFLLGALPLQMLLGFGVAYVVNASWRGRGLIRALLLIPLAISPIVGGAVWKMLLDPLWGAFNAYLGFFGIPALDWLGDPNLALISVIMVDTWRWTPFIILIATAGIMALPADVFEAARVDGANWWHQLRYVALPLLAPVITAAFIIRWLDAVKIFDIVLGTTRGGPGSATNVINLYIYEKAFRSLEFGEASAMSIIVLVISILITLLILRLTRRSESMF